MQYRDNMATKLSHHGRRTLATKPRFSVVIPTRNREATLGPAIETCLRQDYADFELVIVDNASSPETREVVESFQDDRIRYIRRDEPLAMTHNWNMALAETRGDWVCFIGDDDGLMPGALHELDAATKRTDLRALRWDFAIYTWPNLLIEDMANKLAVPANSGADRVCDGIEAVEAMAATPEAGPRGPSIYHGLIERSLIEEALQSGSVFEGRIPDYFSGTLFAALSGQFLQLPRPATIAGLSGRSNGVAHLVSGSEPPTRNDFETLNTSQGLTFHEALPDLNLICIYILDAVFRVQERLKLDPAELTRTSSEIVEISTRTLWQSGRNLENEITELRRYISEHELNLIPEWSERLSEPIGVRPPFIPHDGHEGFDGNWVVIDTIDLNVVDVMTAGTAAGAIYQSFTYCRPELIELRAQVPALRTRILELDASIAGLEKELKMTKAALRNAQNTTTRRVKRRLKRVLGR